MKELPSVIDLPGEDELLMKRLQKRPEFVKAAPRINDDLFSDEMFEFDDIFFPDDWKDYEGADIYTALEELTEEWCRIYAADIKMSDIGLRLICHYGNITGYAIDLVDFDDEKPPGLKIALCKRIIAGINKITTLLGNKNLSSDRKIIPHKEKLLGLREKVIDLRFKLKKRTA
jgi:hypothetical protein